MNIADDIALNVMRYSYQLGSYYPVNVPILKQGKPSTVAPNTRKEVFTFTPLLSGSLVLSCSQDKGMVYEIYKEDEDTPFATVSNTSLQLINGFLPFYTYTVYATNNTIDSKPVSCAIKGEIVVQPYAVML